MIYFKRSWKRFLFYCDINKKKVLSKNKYVLCCNLVFIVADTFLRWGHLDREHVCTFGHHTLLGSSWCPRVVFHSEICEIIMFIWRGLFVVTSKTYHLFVILKCPFYGNTYGLFTKCEVKMARYWPSSNIHFIGDHAMSWRYWIPACPSDDKQFSYFTCPCHYVIGQVLFLRVYGARWSWGP